MIAIDYISTVKQLLKSRDIQDYYLDTLRIIIPSDTERLYTSGQRAHYFLLMESLPVGTIIASENSALQVDEHWNEKSLSKIQEFIGQIVIELPEKGILSEIEFIRAIPRT